MRRGLRQSLIAGYVQDDIRYRPNLSFNVGMRYEFLTIPTEVNGKIALLHNLTDTSAKVGGPVLDRNPTLRNFSPRVGFVWDPFKTGKTSIRAGFGIPTPCLVWLFDTPLTRLRRISSRASRRRLRRFSGGFPSVLKVADSVRHTARASAYSMK
jgi:hypothetical protein